MRRQANLGQRGGVHAFVVGFRRARGDVKDDAVAQPSRRAKGRCGRGDSGRRRGDDGNGGGCGAKGDAHHRVSLSRDLSSVKAVLGKELGIAVLAPDLESLGYRFHSADRCGFGDRAGAHLIYESGADGGLISVFSVALMDTHTAGNGVPGRQRAYVVCDSPPSAAVIAWDDAGATYLICGKAPASDLITLAETIG